ncbi:hypothetical protein DPMN_107240 [Dreissena polymorpha]|uniref:CUB domain-containing protein n=1 Tax=Dreissena polymorpha TaxID=45954 RepID=A0A9D4QJY9_DREPO|nr:hypothetical protein DPMN_107240 [Dreissena polymorpha]
MWLLTAFFVLSLFTCTQAVVVTHTSCSTSSITGTVVEQYLKYSGGDCTWTIVSPAGSQIVLHVRSTQIDSKCGNTTTERDRLEIHFGGSLPATICDENFNHQIYASVYGKMTLKLATPESWSYESKSFEVMFFIAYTSDTALIPNCADRINVTGPGQLMSPNLPSRFSDNDSCSWTFWAPMGIMFYVSFTDLGSTDFLKIYDGLHRSDSLLLGKNNFAVELEPVYTTGHFGRVVFAPNSENQHYGFLLTYDVGNLDPSNISVLEECNETGIYLNTPNRTFFEYLSVSRSNYKTNMDCIWYITAPENHAVEIEFEPGGYGMETNLYCDYDNLAFYEVTGLNDSLKRINRVCGYKVPKYRYQTVGNRMMIEFHSDYLVPAVGFKLRYYAIDMAYPYCREDFKSLDGTYNLQTSYLNANARWILTITSPTIPSYWSTKYENNAEVFWLITVEDPSLYRLVLSFSYSWIESSPGCSVDWFALFRDLQMFKRLIMFLELQCFLH